VGVGTEVLEGEGVGGCVEGLTFVVSLVVLGDASACWLTDWSVAVCSPSGSKGKRRAQCWRRSAQI
jgi:hypothetical protein